MPWRLAIKGETVADVADMAHARAVVMPAQAVVMQCRHRFQVVAVDRGTRVLRQNVLDVHQQQFLMLLFMLQAQFDPSQDFSGVLLRGIGKQLFHGAVDMLAKAVDVIHAGP